MGILWRVDQLYINNEYMIQYHPSTDIHNQSSTLHIPALEAHANISVQCVIVIVMLTENDLSPEVYLYVLGT